MDREAIREWVSVLSDLTYYEVLGVPARSGPDDLKRGFHLFADTFHPDAHAGRPDDEREAIGRIFRQGAEAYRILSDPELRAQYDASLAAGMQPAAASRQSSLPPGRERTAPKQLADRIKSPTARPFVRRAEELAAKGDYKQAKLQLTLAKHHEGESDALTEYIRAIEEKIRAGAHPK